MLVPCPAFGLDDLRRWAPRAALSATSRPLVSHWAQMTASLSKVTMSMKSVPSVNRFSIEASPGAPGETSGFVEVGLRGRRDGRWPTRASRRRGTAGRRSDDR